MSKPCCSVKKTPIRYQRPTPPVPATYADVRLPEEYTTTTNSSFIWQERIYCSACYIFEWNPDGVLLFKWVPSMKMKKVWALANLSKLSGE
jgi:hypothetical protein